MPRHRPVNTAQMHDRTQTYFMLTINRRKSTYFSVSVIINRLAFFTYLYGVVAPYSNQGLIY